MVGLGSMMTADKSGLYLHLNPIYSLGFGKQ